MKEGKHEGMIYDEENLK